MFACCLCANSRYVVYVVAVSVERPASVRGSLYAQPTDALAVGCMFSCVANWFYRESDEALYPNTYFWFVRKSFGGITARTFVIGR